MKSADLYDRVMWVPLSWHGEAFYECSIEAFGLVGKGQSRRKPDALAYALNDLAAQVHKTQLPNP